MKIDLYQKFEDNVSSLFESYYCYPVVKNILSKFIDIYFIVYENYNERFTLLFNQELDFLRKIFQVVADIYLPLIHNYEIDIKGIKLKKRLTDKGLIDKINKTVIILFDNEEGMDKGISAIKKGSYLGLNKEAIAMKIDYYFRDIEYCLDAAENKMLIDKFSKGYESYNIAYMKYEDYKKKINLSVALGDAIGDPNYKSNSSDPLYNRFRIFVNTKEDMIQFKKQANDKFLKSLKALQH